jgi:hypothetical protein
MSAFSSVITTFIPIAKDLKELYRPNRRKTIPYRSIRYKLDDANQYNGPEPQKELETDHKDNPNTTLIFTMIHHFRQ